MAYRDSYQDDNPQGEPAWTEGDEAWQGKEDESREYLNEDPDEADLVAVDSIFCVHCGEDLYEDSSQCPSCGMYSSVEDREGKGKPRWFVIAAIVCILMVLMWSLF